MMMRARKAMTYDGRQLAAGEVFELIEGLAGSLAADRRVLLAAGLADDASDNEDTPPIKRRITYKRRDMRAER